MAIVSKPEAEPQHRADNEPATKPRISAIEKRPRMSIKSLAEELERQDETQYKAWLYDLAQRPGWSDPTNWPKRDANAWGKSLGEDSDDMNEYVGILKLKGADDFLMGLESLKMLERRQRIRREVAKAVLSARDYAIWNREAQPIDESLRDSRARAAR
jgi:hypothetical protein